MKLQIETKHGSNSVMFLRIHRYLDILALLGAGFDAKIQDVL